MNIVDLDKLSEMFWDGNFMEIHKDDIPSIPSAFEGMTNGEVIKAVFPYVTAEDTSSDRLIETDLDKYFVLLRKNWWNAPYKAEGEEIKPNDMTRMFDGVTEIPKDAFKGWTSEELRSKIRKSGAEFLEEVGGEIGSSYEKFIRQMTGNEGGEDE